MSKNILLGVTGSIAASKTEILYKKLIDKHNVKIFSTSEGLKYLSKDSNGIHSPSETKEHSSGESGLS